MKANSILETIGNTPHIRARKLFPDAEVWIKSERSNPGGSIKDRIALSMIEAAEKSGDLKAGGTIVEIHGHTDDQGSADKNQRLSEDRAFAVKKWLQGQSSVNFPDGRIKVFAHGSTEPLDSNATSEGRAKNRRVEMILGTGQAT